ncbi:MAG: hypothetical protein QT02_C0004G0053 [archaeon GW2011_AR9]|nr:MAG: hypothetical protein QT02_C0004G0053 [archaeon GW2011_AR9]HIH13156.1 hypothetical protein [Candidatus Woesearchaeota archaeon]
MDELLVALLGITFLFFLFVILKATALRRYTHTCAICIAVSGTWIILLILWWLGWFENTIIIALLMGQSITGIFYLLEKKVPERWTFFRLPFITSLLIIAYAALKGDIGYALMFISLLWLLFGLIFAYQQNAPVKTMVKKIIECCKRW